MVLKSLMIIIYQCLMGLEIPLMMRGGGGGNIPFPYKVETALMAV